MAAKKKKKDDNKLAHELIPEHVKLSKKEAEEVLNKYNITIKELPKILITDPAIQHLDAENGDIIKVIRKSGTAGQAIIYRGVVED